MAQNVLSPPFPVAPPERSPQFKECVVEAEEINLLQSSQREWRHERGFLSFNLENGRSLTATQLGDIMPRWPLGTM